MYVIIFTTVIILLILLIAVPHIFSRILKYFKFENVTFKKSVLILFLSYVASFVISLILNVINIQIIYYILNLVFTFLVFHYFLNKYYQNNLKQTLKIYIVSNILYVILSLIIIIPTKQFIFDSYIVQGESMSPTLNENEYLLIDKFSKSYQRGDIIIFYNNLQKGFLTKRIIGLPDEKVEIKNKKVFINEVELKENYIFQEVFPNKIIILSNDEYFVLGDNLFKSADSRIFGAIKKDDIVGEVVYNLDEVFNNSDENNQ